MPASVIASVFAVVILPSSSVFAALTFSSAFVPASVIASVFAVVILPSSSVFAALTFSSAFVPVLLYRFYYQFFLLLQY